MRDSTNTLPPFLGQQVPVYPALEEVCRVYAPALIGTNIYPAFVRQLFQTSPAPVLRDRVPCYVWEPNGTKLGPGDYDCRLMTSYQGLPLYVTTCCATGAFGPSSSSSPLRGASSRSS